MWQTFLAFFRLDLNAVCRESRGRFDYHDYPDSDNGGYPWHLFMHHCKRCGKAFII